MTKRKVRFYYDVITYDEPDRECGSCALSPVAFFYEAVFSGIMAQDLSDGDDIFIFDTVCLF